MESATSKYGLHWKHWTILFLFLSLGLTLVAWQLSASSIKAKRIMQFEFQTEQLMGLVKERLSSYEDALRAGVAAIHSQSQGIDVVEWGRFADNLDIEQRYPGINGIGVVYRILPDNLDKFLERERKLQPDFRIHPKHSNSEYWPITYIWPLEVNKEALGLDMAFEINRFTAAQKAQDSGLAQITGPIVLVQDEKQTPGFLQFVPIYKLGKWATLQERRDNFVGHVYAPFIVSNFIQGTLAKANRQVLFRIRDGEQLLYNELPTDSSRESSRSYHQTQRKIDVYGRPWVFDIETSPESYVGLSDYHSTLILIIGLIIDGILFALFLGLSRSQKTALQLAERMTEKLRVSERYFRHIIQAAPCGIVIIDEDGLVETANPHACDLLEYAEIELVNQSINKVFHADSFEADARNQESFWKNVQQQDLNTGKEVCCVTKSHSHFFAEIGVARFEGESGGKVLLTIIDMTRVVDMTDELKRSNKELNDFASVASHDLKAPLQGIIKLSNWIFEGVEPFADEETKRYLDLLQSRAARLEKLLDDLLSYARLNRRFGDFQVVDVKELVTSLFELQSPPESFALEFDTSFPVFETSVAPLEIIFRNLLGNAVKHHDKDTGTITISVAETQKFYEFTVCDDGPGIDPQFHQRAFELFKTLKPRDEIEGSGMGLSIIKKLLEYQHCSIRIDSEKGKGACFVFTWPKVIIQTEERIAA